MLAPWEVQNIYTAALTPVTLYFTMVERKEAAES
jgi:hypothetical protein